MGCLTAQSPATIMDCLDMAGPWPTMRKVFLWQHQNGESISIFDDQGLLAMVFLVRREDGVREFALALRARARERMLELCRMAQRTLGEIAETETVIICHVMDGNQSGSRMARLVGFEPQGGTLWKWSGQHVESGFRMVRRRNGQGGSGAECAAPASCE